MNYFDREKPDIREQTLKHGLSFPSDVELVMLILGSGVKGHSIKSLAEDVIEILHESNNEDIVKKLCTLPGIGTGKSLAIAAAIELGRRKTSHLNTAIRSPHDVVPFVQSYSMMSKEHFLCVTLNGAHEIIQIRVVSIGTTNRTLVHPREVFSEALVQNASAIIVCHNHPSGNCKPSDDDLKTTASLMAAAEIVGISFLDHIIIGKEKYFSFLEHGLLSKIE